LNSNDNVPCIFNGNGNGNDNRGGFQAGGGGNNSRTGTTKCFDVREVGVIQLRLPNGDVTVAVPPTSGIPTVTRLTLTAVTPSTVPAPPSGAVILDSLVWTLDAQNGCSGPALGALPAAVNLGITYNVSADKSKVQIVRLVGGQWQNVDTVPDPSPTNPYVSSTIRDVGTYALIQRP